MASLIDKVIGQNHVKAMELLSKKTRHDAAKTLFPDDIRIKGKKVSPDSRQGRARLSNKLSNFLRDVRIAGYEWLDKMPQSEEVLDKLEMSGVKNPSQDHVIQFVMVQANKVIKENPSNDAPEDAVRELTRAWEYARKGVSLRGRSDSQPTLASQLEELISDEVKKALGM